MIMLLTTINHSYHHSVMTTTKIALSLQKHRLPTIQNQSIWILPSEIQEVYGKVFLCYVYTDSPQKLEAIDNQNQE